MKKGYKPLIRKVRKCPHPAYRILKVESKREGQVRTIQCIVCGHTWIED